MPDPIPPSLSLPGGTDLTALVAALAGTSKDLLLLVDGGGIVRWLGPSWSTVTGYEVDASVGQRFDGLVDPRHHDRLSLVGDPPPAYGGAGHFEVRNRLGRVLRMTSLGAAVQVGAERMHLLTWRDGTALDAFAGVLAGLGRDQPLAEAMELLTRAAEARFPAACAWVQLIDDGGLLQTAAGPHIPRVWLRAADGFAHDDPEGPTSLPCIDGAPLFVADLGAPDCAIGAREAAREAGFRALWSAPIKSSSGALLGAYSLLFLQPREWDRIGARLLEIGAELGAALVESSQAGGALQRAHDGLTFHMDNSPLAVVEVDRRARVIRWSPQAEAMLGWSAADAVGRSLADLHLIDGRDHERAMQVVRGMDAGTYQRGVVQGRMRSREDHIVESEWHISALRDESGEPVSFLGFGQDISERLRREDALNHTQKLESLGVLAGGIAHDFNNLLTSVMGHAGLAMQGLEPGSALLRHLRPIEDAAERGAELTQQLLAYAGKGRYVVRVVDLNDLVAGMTDLIAVSMSKKTNVRYRLYPNTLPVDADANQLQQVVLNLATNASEALGTREGLVTITTDLVHLDPATIEVEYVGQEVEPGPYARLEVADTGCGMDAETLARAFDPFFTTHATGRGLGLSAVAGIVRTHRGAIRIASEPRRGTTFWVLMPLAAAAAARAPAAPVRPCVLVVDDEKPVRLVLGEILGHAGYLVVYAADGLEARSIFADRHSTIDLVILDMTMPHMDGAETFKALSAIDADVPVLIASGFTERQVSQRFGKTGPAGFIQKPFRLDKLVAIVKELARVRG